MKEFRKFKTQDVSYLFSAPNGVAGDLTRVDESNVEPANLLAISSVFPQAYGLAMVYGTGGVQAWQASNVAADFAGSLVREVPSIAGAVTGSDTFTGNVPNPVQPNGLCVRGYMSVVCQHGTPVRGGVVYVCIAASAGRVIGGFESGADGSNNIALSTTQATWASDGVDAFLNGELRIAR